MNAPNADQKKKKIKNLKNLPKKSLFNIPFVVLHAATLSAR